MWDFLGGLVGGIGSVFGSELNTSSQQSINAANLQQQMSIASGAQLPALVANAKAAGLNPLAVLGQSAPGGMAAVATNPGSTFTSAGRGLQEAFAGIKADELAEQQLLKAKVDVANARTLGNNAAIAGTRDMWTLEAMQKYLDTHPGAAPPGVQPYSLGTEGAEWFQKLWNNPWSLPRSLGQ